MKSNSNTKGFTIVELLIVIVVIAILAAISIVAYNGIQNRANDATVESDLSYFAKQIQLKEVDTGSYPAGGAIRTGTTSTGNSTVFPGFTINLSKGAYSTSASNFFYCTGVESSNKQSFTVLARSKSGNTYTYNSLSGVTKVLNGSVGEVSACQNYVGTHTWSYGFYAVNQSWWPWVN